MPHIRFTNSAEADLLELWLNIAEDNLAAADESLINPASPNVPTSMAKGYRSNR